MAFVDRLRLDVYCVVWQGFHVYSQAMVRVEFESYGYDLKLLLLPCIVDVSQIQVNEEDIDKVLDIEQEYNEIRKPFYLKRNDIIKTIPDFWLTAVSETIHSL